MEQGQTQGRGQRRFLGCKIHLYPDTSTYRIDVELSYGLLGPMMEILVPVLPNVELGVWVQDFPDEVQMDTLLRLPNVTFLGLDCWMDTSAAEDQRGFLTRHVDADGMLQRSFPALRRLYFKIGLGYTLEDILEFGQTRFSKDDSALRKLELSVPIVLKAQEGADLAEAFGERVLTEVSISRSMVNWEEVEDW